MEILYQMDADELLSEYYRLLMIENNGYSDEDVTYNALDLENHIKLRINS